MRNTAERAVIWQSNMHDTVTSETTMQCEFYLCIKKNWAQHRPHWGKSTTRCSCGMGLCHTLVQKRSDMALFSFAVMLGSARLTNR
eukprot:12402093-Karenia_brevis.AAC.2